jgi:hypothetical protein
MKGRIFDPAFFCAAMDWVFSGGKLEGCLPGGQDYEENFFRSAVQFRTVGCDAFAAGLYLDNVGECLER